MSSTAWNPEIKDTGWRAGNAWVQHHALYSESKRKGSWRETAPEMNESAQGCPCPGPVCFFLHFWVFTQETLHSPFSAKHQVQKRETIF